MKSLTRTELANILDAARKCPQDYYLILVTFNHGLRASEAVNLDANNIIDGHLVVQRLKGSKRTTQPLLPDEREFLLDAAKKSGKFFPISRWTFQRRMAEYGKAAGVPEFKLHPHALKHSCGRLAYLGGMKVAELQTYLGHVNGGNTMIYLEADESEAASAFAAAVGK